MCATGDSTVTDRKLLIVTSGWATIAMQLWERNLSNASPEILLSRFQETHQVWISNSCVETGFYLWTERKVVGGQAGGMN